MAVTEADDAAQVDVHPEVSASAPPPPRRLQLSEELQEEIAQHGEATFPDECCGVLLGTEQDGERVVSQLLPIENEWSEEERRRRFLITPQEMLRAEKEGRKAGLDVLGFYHSHPDAPARPSSFDREHAWPWYAYVIAEIRGGEYVMMTCWALRDERDDYDEVQIVTGTPSHSEAEAQAEAEAEAETEDVTA